MELGFASCISWTFCVSSAPLRASNGFLTDLFLTLEEPSKNIIISPFSIFTGLSLLELGTAGRTKASFESALHYPGSGGEERIHSEGRGVITSLDKLSRSSNETFILQTSNKVFLDEAFSITPDYRYLALISRTFSSLVSQKDRVSGRNILTWN